MASDSTERLLKTVGLVLAVLLPLIGGVTSYVTTQADVRVLRKDVAELQKARDDLSREQQATTKQLIEYRSDTRYIIQTLGEMKAQLDRLTSERRLVVPVRGQ